MTHTFVIRKTSVYFWLIVLTAGMTLFGFGVAWVDRGNDLVKSAGVAFVILATILLFAGLIAKAQKETEVSKRRAALCDALAIPFGTAGGVTFAWAEITGETSRTVWPIAAVTAVLVVIIWFAPRRFRVDYSA